jgi:GTP-binding protein Era
MNKAGYIAIIGRPNSGKSTLLNAVLQTQISIVTPKAQTTRDRIFGIFTEPQGQIVFIDTPGIHRARPGGLNQYMVEEAKEALDSPNLIWYLVDPFSELQHEEAVLQLLEKAPQAPLMLLMNKMDLAQKKNCPKLQLEEIEKFEKSIIQALEQKGFPPKEVFRISGLSKNGMKELLEDSWAIMPEGMPFYPDPEQVSDRPTRYFVSEKIRERLFYSLGEELPYSCAVEIESFQENAKPVRIEAVIYVERDSQKGMVIGQGGKKIKEIGQSARMEIEKFLGEKIFLGLKVKLLEHWTQNVEGMKKIGYAHPALSPKQKKKSG